MKKGKKFIVFFLLLSLLTINCTTITPSIVERRHQERRYGAELEIWGKGGKFIKGELIAVKQNTLLLLDSERGTDVSVDIRDIKVIKIVKKSYTLPLAVSGLVIGILLGYNIGESEHPNSFGNIAPKIGAVIGGASCALIGGITGAIAGIDKTIQIEGMTDSEIQEALDKLRNKARVPDYK